MKMSNHLEIGRFGEDEAVAYLEKVGYDVLAKNWRFKNLEIDIIAKDNGVLTFVEVKPICIIQDIVARLDLIL